MIGVFKIFGSIFVIVRKKGNIKNDTWTINKGIGPSGV